MKLEPVLRKDLMALVDAYLKTTGRTMGALSFAIYGNALFLEEFKAGRRSVSIRLFDDMTAELERIWPQPLAIPKLTLVRFRPHAHSRH